MRLESQVTQVLADMLHVLAGERTRQTHDQLPRELMSALGVETPLCDDGRPSSEQVDLFEAFILLGTRTRVLEEQCVQLTSHIVNSLGRI